MTSPNRVAQLAGINTRAGGNVYRTAVPGGYAGASIMTFFSIVTFYRNPTSAIAQQLFGRYVGGNSGYVIYAQTSTIVCLVTNATPAAVNRNTSILQAQIGQPLIIIVTYNNGTLNSYFNGVASAPTVLGAGYTGVATATSVGCRSDSIGSTAVEDAYIHEVGALDNYDASGSIATLNAQWTQDMEQGRELTWPRAPAVNSDYNWSARSACLGLGGCAPIWTPRFTPLETMTRSGAPQSSSVPARFA